MTEREFFHSGPLPASLAYGLGAVVAIWVVVMLVGELRRRPNKLRWAAIAVRLAIVGILTMLLAQPNLLITRHATQEGHTLVLVDDSASMFTKDDWSSADAQLNLARALEFPEISGRPTQWLDLLARLKEEHRQFDVVVAASEDAATSVRGGLPWSDRSQDVVSKSPAALDALKTTLTDISRQSGLAPAAGRLVGELTTALAGGGGKDLAQFATHALDQNDWLTLARQARQCSDQLKRLEQLLAEQQAAADQTFLTTNNRQSVIADRINKLTRYDMSQQIIQKAAPLAEATRLNLVSGAQTVDALRAVGKTQLVQPLVDALTSRPLELINAVYLFSDGGQNCNFDLAALDIFRKRGVKLVFVGVGGAQSDAPLTLVDQDCPTTIPRGTPLPVRLEFRVNLPKDVPVELSYSLEGAAAAPAKGKTEAPAASGSHAPHGMALPYRTTVVTDGSGFLHHHVLLAASVPGAQTLRVDARVKEPNLEATHRFPVYVRDVKPSVLLVADRPDKLTESILAQQEYGVRVVPVFTYGNIKNAKRSSSKQSIPKTAKDWGAHDLIILKGKPFPGFTPEDAVAIATQMRTLGTAVLVISDEGNDYLRAFAQPLGWPAADYGALAAADSIAPAADAAHLPSTILNGEVIRNQNIWQQFAPPAKWQGVPKQTFSLVQHPGTKAPVMSLGLYNAGKLVCFGLGGLARMNEWQTDHFETFVRALVMDLLTPTGEWKGTAPAIGVYPPVPVPGQPCMILARSKDNQAKNAEVRIEGAHGGSDSLKLAGEGGWLSTRHVFSEEGDNQLQLDGATLHVRCERQESAETRDTSLRDDLLKQMADAAGGSYVPLVRLDEALHEMPAKTRETVSSRNFRTTDFTTLLLVLFLGLVVTDFVLRKRMGMVL